MQFIKTRDEFERILTYAENFLLSRRRFPRNVFSEDLNHYLFLGGNVTQNPSFLKQVVSEYLSLTKETGFYYFVIDPLPHFYGVNQDNLTYKAVEFSIDDHEYDFMRVLRSDTNDSILLNSKRVILFPKSGDLKWCIFTDFISKISVLAFTTIDFLNLFKNNAQRFHFENFNLLNVEEAARKGFTPNGCGFIYEKFRSEFYIAEFIRSYS